MNVMEFDKNFLTALLQQAAENPRLRQNFDLRTSQADTSQRMLNAMLPQTVVAIHKHDNTAETVICLCGKLDEVIYEAESSCGDASEKAKFKEKQRIRLDPANGKYGCQIPKGAWHSVEVIEPSVIFEAKDGAYKQ